MTEVLKHLSRFILIGLLQIFLFSRIEIGWGIHLMIYPIFIFLLPITIAPFYLMLLAFGMGIIIDVTTHTFGLHASAATFIAYLRPFLLKYFAPRDGYESGTETNFFVMGSRWFIFTFGTFLFLHHAWFFIMEQFKLNDMLYVLQKIILSIPLAFLLCLFFQFIFVRKPLDR
jgi:hypothetical protein